MEGWMVDTWGRTAPSLKKRTRDPSIFPPLPDNSKKDCEGNRNVSGENQPGQSLTTDRNEVGQFSVINPERLDDASEPVAEMGREQEEANDVKQRNQWMAEPENQHVVNVVTAR